jgi:hypothetical protein
VSSRERSKTDDFTGRNQSLRLIFSYKNNDIRLVNVQSVNIIPPPSDPIEYPANQTGFSYELKDLEGRILYRRIIENPVSAYREVFSNDPDNSIIRQKVSEPRGTFVLLVPDIQGARSIVLFGGGDIESTDMKAKEIGRFDLVPERSRSR